VHDFDGPRARRSRANPKPLQLNELPACTGTLFAEEATTMVQRVRGCVNIANDVLADLAGYAALESYGIVGMASPTLRDGVAQILPAQKLRKGVRVGSTDEGIVVDLFVVIEFGTNLAEVSHNLADRVRYVLTNTAEVEVANVDIHVQGVKVRTP
jgi:uncharacterized alkaline shock family protein YloU